MKIRRLVLRDGVTGMCVLTGATACGRITGQTDRAVPVLSMRIDSPPRLRYRYLELTFSNRGSFYGMLVFRPSAVHQGRTAISKHWATRQDLFSRCYFEPVSERPTTLELIVPLNRVAGRPARRPSPAN